MMGGLVEDRILDVLWNQRKSAREVQTGLGEVHEPREYGIVNYHLRKMALSQELKREKEGGVYVYWNPAMVGSPDSVEGRRVKWVG
jgi:hypothetical protein